MAKPKHPYWCDDCDGSAPFKIPGCDIEHEKGCPRKGEIAMKVYKDAMAYCKRTGERIP